MRLRTWFVPALTAALGTGLLAPPAAAAVDPQFPTGYYTISGGDSLGYLTGEPGHLKRTIYPRMYWVDDNLTYDKDLKHVFFAGDGSPGVPWDFGDSSYTASEYSYTRTGTFRPYVELTDEDGNTSTIDIHVEGSPDEPATVTVLRDDQAPVISIRLPGPFRRDSVAAWKVIRGTAIDAESGLRPMLMHVLQRRNGRWFVYDFFTHRWYRGSTSYAWTYKHLARYRGHPYPGANDVWDTRPIRAMTKGRLVVQLEGADRAGNFTRARPVVVQLTRR